MTASTEEKSGCLSIFFPSLKRSNDELVSEAPPEELPYRLRDDFLSPTEFSFYKVLSSVGGTRLTIQSKVRLADVFFVARPNENFAFFNRIAQKHLDFLVCDSITMKPIIGVELDDSTHKRNNRQERDDFVERVCEVAGLPLLRLPVQREYNTSEIAAEIAPFLKEKAKRDILGGNAVKLFKLDINGRKLAKVA
jgi:very-short-patch-repair endonuclease